MFNKKLRFKCVMLLSSMFASTFMADATENISVKSSQTNVNKESESHALLPKPLRIFLYAAGGPWGRGNI